MNGRFRAAARDRAAGSRRAPVAELGWRRSAREFTPANCRECQVSSPGAVSTVLKLVRNLVRDERGEDLIEYGLLAAFVAAVALVTIILDPLSIKGSLINAYLKAKAALDAQ